MICLNLSLRWSIHTAYTVHIKWPSGQQSIHVLSPLIVIFDSEIQKFFFNLIASLFFFLYCDIQTNDRHWGIMSKTDQYNNLFQRIWVLIYYYCSSLVSRCVYNTYENRNIPTFVDWPFQIRPYIPLVRVQVSAKEIKIVKFHFTNLSRLL